MAKDYYQLLGLSKGATSDEIKKAFRRLAHEHHPDKGGDAQRFKDINEAYQVLGDAKKRALYDQYGSAAFDPQSGMGGGGFGGFDPSGFKVDFGGDFGDLGDLFGGMFGFGGASSRNRGVSRGKDVEVDVTIEFIECVTGADKTLKLLLHDRCSVCQGSGAEKGSSTVACETCQGSGQVRQMQRTILGSFQTAAVCPACHGRGSRPDKVCSACKGKGVERKEKELRVSIPAGIDDGETLRVDQAGEYPGPGGQAGDLYIHVRVKRHAVFSRQVNDVLSTAAVAFSTLNLGGSIDVQTVDGQVTLRIPEGTDAGTVFKLRGKGIPFSRSNGRGDHLVTVTPEVKKKLTKDQRQALQTLR